jgi:hypothetical protein
MPMARHLPAVLNGLETGKTVRDDKGRFVAGSAPGPGRPANPYSRWQAELHTAALAEVGVTDVRALVRTLLRLGKGGNLAATRLVFEWIIGPPPTPVHPDRLAEDELAVRRGLPTLVDWVSLADEQADREPRAVDPADEDPAEPEALPALPDPPLRTVLAWAIQELAEAQTALRASHPPPLDPATSWLRFAEMRLEFDPQAAVEVDQLLLAYLRWCGAHGEPVLEEAKIMAALEAHGARVSTGAYSQVRTAQGVRVTA